MLLKFLSIQAQDFIEDSALEATVAELSKFLSIQAQDFIEDRYHLAARCPHSIPELFMVK